VSSSRDGAEAMSKRLEGTRPGGMKPQPPTAPPSAPCPVPPSTPPGRTEVALLRARIAECSAGWDDAEKRAAIAEAEVAALREQVRMLREALTPKRGTGCPPVWYECRQCGRVGSTREDIPHRTYCALAAKEPKS
jgi:hypothetical protein